MLHYGIVWIGTLKDGPEMAYKQFFSFVIWWGLRFDLLGLATTLLWDYKLCEAQEKLKKILDFHTPLGLVLTVVLSVFPGAPYMQQHSWVDGFQVIISFSRTFSFLIYTQVMLVIFLLSVSHFCVRLGGGVGRIEHFRLYRNYLLL